MHLSLSRFTKYTKHNSRRLVNSVILSLVVFASIFGGTLTGSAQEQCQVYNPRLPNFGPNCIPLIKQIQGNPNGLSGIIIQIANIAIFVVAAIAVLMIVYAGFLFVIDGGSGERAGKGKKIVVNAIIGVIIAIASYTIVSLVSGLVTNLDISSAGTGGGTGGQFQQ